MMLALVATDRRDGRWGATVISPDEPADTTDLPSERWLRDYLHPAISFSMLVDLPFVVPLPAACERA